MMCGMVASHHFIFFGGPCMRNFLLTRARTAFWIWSAPAILALLSCAASGLKGWALLTGYLLAIAWILVGWVVINFQPRIAMRPALAALDHHCDPEPLLELCRTVCRQNPDSLLFQVYQSWALSLLGKDKEALPVLDRVANHPRLTKDALALLVWSAALPSGDPRQEWAAEKLTALKPKMRANQRALVDQVINQRRSFALMQAAPPQLEPLLQQDLERAGCLREKVAAHMALGVYYHQREDWAKAQMHLEFVLDNANKLHVRTQAEKLLCKLPSAFL